MKRTGKDQRGLLARERQAKQQQRAAKRAARRRERRKERAPDAGLKRHLERLAAVTVPGDEHAR